MSRPEGTTFGVEDYFRVVRALGPGAVYVGHVVGRHVGMAEQLAGAASVEEAVGGAEYRGHLRLARGLWQGTRFDGAVVLALDHRHLMEFTQHVLPLSGERVVFPSYLSGNYAFLFDDEGWIITHPKLWDIRGLDARGRWVPPYTASSSPADVAAGRIPFRLDDAGFVHPSYPAAAQAVRQGLSGVIRASNVAGVDKVMAYAPVRFRHGSYATSGVFGGVTIGARTEAFHREALATGEVISRASRQTLRTGLLLAVVLAFVVVIASLWLTRAIALPIRRVAATASRIADGDLGARATLTSGDEVGELAADFDRMAGLLEEKDRRLQGSLEDLARSRDDARAYAGRLEEQLGTLRHLQSISEFLGTTFDREQALKIILRTCVQGLGFDRALIYLREPGGGSLRCLAAEGFGAGAMDECLAEPIDLAQSASAPACAVKTGRAASGAAPGSAKEGAGFRYVPMKIRDAVVGALGVGAARPLSPLPEHLEGGLQILAGQAARAIERARLFEAVNRERSFVAAVIASLGTGLVTLDAFGRVLTANPYAEGALGCGPGGLVGATLPARGADPALASWVEGLLGGRDLEPREFELVTPEGARSLSWVPSRLETEGGIGLILQFRDVTAEKALSRSLERVDRLASLGRMAAGVAHEVRNPLTGVSILLDDLHDRLSSEADRALVARALQEIERLDGIVQGLLDYSRVGGMEKRLLRLAEVVEGSLFLVQKASRSQAVAVEVRVAPEVPAVLGDPEKLKQALLNFYINALQAMPSGGRLEVSVEPAAGGACVRIADTGTGVPGEHLDKIFEPFFTLRPGGSGLGLSIAHTIVTDHGGRIEVASGEGQGAVFRVFLPAGEVGGLQGSSPS
ncbi:MAG: HAMP domain-containing protein [Deltaproteobacteria bacterium]|nr:HAMP domain-containing protein [Deltaproteobacteria bacterium]